MTDVPAKLCQRLKRFGYAQNQQLTLYGEVFEVLSDPFVIGPNLVFVDARERRSGSVRRVRVPLNIVEMAKRETAA